MPHVTADTSSITPVCHALIFIQTLKLVCLSPLSRLQTITYSGVEIRAYYTLQMEFLSWWKLGLDTGLFLVQCSLCIRGGLFFWIPDDGKLLVWRRAVVKVSAAVLVKGCPQSTRESQSLSFSRHPRSSFRFTESLPLYSGMAHCPQITLHLSESLSKQFRPMS